jgi:hypothetical protein
VFYIGNGAFLGTTKLTIVTFRGTPQMSDNSFPGQQSLMEAYRGRGGGPGKTYEKTAAEWGVGSGEATARWRVR